eukprot:gene21091-25341_t
MLADVNIVITNDEGVEVQNFDTKDDGEYYAGGLSAGDYCMTFKHKEYKPIDHAKGEESDVDKDGKKCFTIPPSDGTNEIKINAGFSKSSGFKVSGFTFLDGDSNGGKEDAEKFLANVKVTLYKDDEVTIVKAFTTKDDGKYSFEDIEAGSYCLRMMDGTGKKSPTVQGKDSKIDDKGYHCFNLTEDYIASGGFEDTYSISGINFDDLNKNGVNDKEKYYGPIRVTLSKD